MTFNETLLAHLLNPPPPTLRPLEPIVPGLPDSYTLLILPILTYWLASLFFHVLDTFDLLSRYRLHTPEELLKRNHVTRRDVIRDVIVQQVIQTIMGFGMTYLEGGTEATGGELVELARLYPRVESAHTVLLRALAVVGVDGAGLEAAVAPSAPAAALRALLARLGFTTGAGAIYTATELLYYCAIPTARIALAIFVLDTWQYWWHRAMHEVKWLYRTFHSRHHRLYVPYAFGALYNHPVEGLIMDTIGAGLGHKLSGLGTRGGMVFFSFSTLKTVDDHCGYALPWDPLQRFFSNNAGYHDVHHQSWGIKTNYSQPFLICWDRWLGTMWTGDTALKYAASRERALAAVREDTEPAAAKLECEAEPLQEAETLRPERTNQVRLDVGSKLKKEARSRSRTPGVEEGLRRSARLRTVN